MKYIRTKDGRIGKVTHEDNKNYRAKFGRKYPLISKEDVIKVADTIEELCDRFVLITNRAHYGFGHFRNIKRVVLGKEEKFIACYGAIWTDDGLKYVAKMNDKGELELL